MPKISKGLCDKDVFNAKPQEKAYRLYDRDGLCILIRNTGTKVWQYHYKYREKRRTLTIGQYLQKDMPGHISIKHARMARYEARALLAQGIDPSTYKQERINSVHGDDGKTFEALAREWHDKGTWAPKHAKNILRSLEDDVFPLLGKKQITDITRRDIVTVLEKVEERGACDVAKRICQRCTDIFDYALGKGLCEENPALGRAKFIKPPKRQNRPHLKEEQVGEFLHNLDDYHGKDYIRLALNLLAMTFVRPGELRHAVWKEIDRDGALWRIPAERMKMNRDHVVPLSRQALELLDELDELTGKSDYLFPGLRSPHKPISDVTLLKLLKIMGYEGKRKITPHGFRHTASTILNEHGFNSDHIEKQLAHVQKNKVRGTYNHADYLDGRREMMQWYADHLDALKESYTPV